MSLLTASCGVSIRHFPTKVVVRLLPPTLEEEDCSVAIDAVIEDSSKTSRTFVAGRSVANPTPEEPNLNARCYLNFSSHIAAVEFIKVFHGHVFWDDRGDSFRSVVAFAPFQQTAKVQKKDLLANTIETDSHFQHFISNTSSSVSPTVPAIATPTAPFVSMLVKSLTRYPTRSGPMGSNRIQPERPTSGRSKPQTAEPVPERPKSGKRPSSGKKAPKVPESNAQPKKVTLLKRS